MSGYAPRLSAILGRFDRRKRLVIEFPNLEDFTLSLLEALEMLELGPGKTCSDNEPMAGDIDDTRSDRSS